MADSKLQDLNSGVGVVTPADANFIYMEQGTTAKFCTLTVLVDAYLKAELNFLENEAGSIALGLTAQDSYTSGTNNTSIGVNSLTGNTTGSNNTAVGKHALDANVTGNANTAVGSDAGGAQAGATDDNNTFIGHNAGLLANGSASGGNTVVGALALDAAVTAVDATAVGLSALGASTADGNTAVGARALAANVTGLRNVAMGVDAGATQDGATDDDNTFIGNLSGNVASLSASGGNTAVGSNSMLASTTAIDCVAVGFNALAANITGNTNTAVGADAMLLAAGATDDNNVAIGFAALSTLNASASGDNTAVGAQALAAAATSIDATAVGKSALAASTAAGNTAVGARALEANVAGLRNVAVGVDAGTTSAGANDNDNTFVGNLAGTVANGSASGGNVGVGSNAMLASTTAIDCTAVGFNALAANIAGNTNTAIGSDAMLLSAGANDNDCVAVGFGALAAMNGTASGENTAVGSQAGAALTTGDNNTLIGNDTGATLTTGDNNVLIGSNADVSAAGVDNETVIGTRLSDFSVKNGEINNKSGYYEMFDDFNMKVLDETNENWILNKGSDGASADPVIVIAEGGTVFCDAGFGDGTVAQDSSQIVWAIPVQADSGGLFFEARLNIEDITGCSVNVGLTDITTLEEPFTNTTDTISAVANNAVCFVFDDAATTKEWFTAGVDGTTLATGRATTGIAPANGVFQTLRCEIDADGEGAQFYINGVQTAGTLSAAAVAASTNLFLTAIIVGDAGNGAAVGMTVDYLKVGYNR